MTKPINIYLQSRIYAEVPFNRVECRSSGKSEISRIKTHEINSLRILVDKMRESGISLEMLNGFFYGYKIPQIGKEFDLLKFTDTASLNIELKSRGVPQEQILAQLKKNKYYLAHLGKENFFCSVITDSLTCYMLAEDESLHKIDFSVISDKIKSFESGYITDVDGLFRASDFLVSPLYTPDKFIKGEYFLTPAQEQIKRKALKAVKELSDYGFFSLTGKPGTGKTLLLYDMAKELSFVGATVVIHCGKLSDRQKRLNGALKNFCVISEEEIESRPEIVGACRFVLVDEAHGISPEQFGKLCDKVKADKKICVFSCYPEQSLSGEDRLNGIIEKINSLSLCGQYKLSERIRTNKELASFISSVRNINKRPRIPLDCGNVSLSYANNSDEARSIIEYYRNHGYVFINYTSDPDDSRCALYESDFDARNVVGQEFDKVLMLMDDQFYYDERGMLHGAPHSDSDCSYLDLFYRGITRVREKLALVIVDAPDLLEKISSVI